MALITLNRKIFEKEIGKLDEKMQDRISMFGTPLERFDDETMELEIFPNRPDLLSYQGFKRSFLAFLGKKTGMKKYEMNKPEKDYQVIIDSSVKEVRPYTACAIVRDLKLDDEKIKEIIEIQEKLHITLGRKRKKVAIGIYPLEKIKLPITLKALEPDYIKFIPLESDKEMSGLQILQKHPTGKEYSHLLAGKSKFPVFMDSENKVLSMPPIINSQLTGKVTEETKDVFIECSGFDFKVLKKCLNILVLVFAEMGGKIYQMELKGAPEKLSPSLDSEKMKLSLENTNKLLGIKIDEKKLRQLLENMGHDYNQKTNEVEIGPWRTDILHEVDLIEDVAIAYGYENFAPEIPSISTIGQENPEEAIKRKISEILAGLNLLEVSNYHLTNKEYQFRKMGIPEKQEKDFVELENSKTEYNILRKDLSSFLLRNLSENIDSEYPQKIFEIGTVFELKKDISEKEKLAIAITPGNFTEAKQILMCLFKSLALKTNLKESEISPPHLIEGRTASIMFEDKEIGILGEVHPKILKNWKIKMPVAILEMDLKEIFKELIK
ncbi:MAG: phenylalanine--tRNA ligase subunit beta [Candidatus Pacearchaeota archaeon]|nr:phenylalanine--tRNA ligase subunit beta [Candidatus Pacearchaeota archaeon]